MVNWESKYKIFPEFPFAFKNFCCFKIDSQTEFKSNSQENTLTTFD